MYSNIIYYITLYVFEAVYITINSMVLKVAATLKRMLRVLCDCINNRLMSFQSRVEYNDLSNIATSKKEFKSRQHYGKCRKRVEEALPQTSK